MSGAEKKQWGITPPISEAEPTDKDLVLHNNMVAELKREKNFESEEDRAKKDAFIAKMGDIVEAFVKHVGRIKGMSKSVIEESGGKVVTFGSYRLGILSPGSDIDTLVVAPMHVSRDDFFRYFPDILREHSAPGAIENLVPVRDTGVPLIALEYSGLDIDLVFVSIKVPAVPRDLNLDDARYMNGLDEVDIKSLNGTRVTDRILALVPNQAHFRHALRTVKLWAKRRAIYGNVQGFIGGVSWALMVARACQLYPRALGGLLVAKFFWLFTTWKWPNPVELGHKEDGPNQQREWNPMISRQDAAHLMPILTPTFPRQNSTYNITHSTQKILRDEFARGYKITQEIVAGRKSWADLFERQTFFTRDFKYYLSVVASARTPEAHSIWEGFVNSRVRRLITGIEGSDANVAIARPFNKGFERKHCCKTDEEVEEILQGNVNWVVKDSKVKQTDAGNELVQSAAASGNVASTDKLEEQAVEAEGEAIAVYTTTFYVGIELGEGKSAKSLDISFPVTEFKRMCRTMFDKFDEASMDVRVVHTRCYDLPDDVFEAGEKKPVRAKKAKKANGQNAQKRDVAEAGLDGTNGHTAKRHQPTNDQTG